MVRLRGPTITLLVVFCGVFLVEQVWLTLGGDLHLFALSLPLDRRPWTVVTSVYAHSSVAHLAANAIALLVLGLGVERVTSALRYHLFFIVTGALAGLTEVYAVATLGFGGTTRVAVLGASGAVFALLGYTLSGNALSNWILDRLPRWLNGTIVLTIAVGVTVATAAPRVALVAHFTGLLVGLTAGRYRLLHVRA